MSASPSSTVVVHLTCTWLVSATLAGKKSAGRDQEVACSNHAWGFISDNSYSIHGCGTVKLYSS